MGSDILGNVVTGRALSISIHAPAWGATVHVVCGFGMSHISIHAPAWGATEQDEKPKVMTQISIHAPAWGATSLHNTSRRGE